LKHRLIWTMHTQDHPSGSRLRILYSIICSVLLLLHPSCRNVCGFGNCRSLMSHNYVGRKMLA